MKKGDVIDRIGENHITNEGYTVEIIECCSSKNCTIRFGNGVIIENKEYRDIKRGVIKNPYHLSVCGVGYLGVGKHNNKAHLKVYNTWVEMLKRCYSKKHQEKHPTYIKCSVAEEWHNFQNFVEWYDENYIEGYHLDKDILVKGNKIYSPETCCFVPIQINSLLVKCNKVRGKCPIGVHKVGNKFQSQLTINCNKVYLGFFNTPEEAFQSYKIAKEKEIKIVADKWKDKISPQVYMALNNYKVEITD